MATQTWQDSAARLASKIEDAESLSKKLTRLIYSGRRLWNHYMRLSMRKDRLILRHAPQEEIDMAVKTLRTCDGELYVVESQIAATDRAILELPEGTDPHITHSSRKRQRRREGTE